jgi:radical SAM protein with 4Fe4S-binding SPASM domain
LIEKIASDLEDIQFDGRITFTGFGEPLLYKDLIAAISILKSKVSKVKWIEIVTNGDYITRDRVLALDNAGCTNVTVSMYDGDMSHVLLPMFQGTDIDVTLKHSYNGFLEVNRNEMLVHTTILDKSGPCHLPFYKMVIDIDGEVILCSNDWARVADLGNVTELSIADIWLDRRYADYRKNLVSGDRKPCEPCRRCNIQGNLYGADSVEIWRKHL